jgi:hypothetical protein
VRVCVCMSKNTFEAQSNTARLSCVYVSVYVYVQRIYSEHSLKLQAYPVCMCVARCIYMYSCVYVRVCIVEHWTLILYVCVCVLCVCVCVCVCVYIYMCVCVCVCVFVCVIKAVPLQPLSAI